MLAFFVVSVQGLNFNFFFFFDKLLEHCAVASSVLPQLCNLYFLQVIDRERERERETTERNERKGTGGKICVFLETRFGNKIVCVKDEIHYL